MTDRFALPAEEQPPLDASPRPSMWEPDEPATAEQLAFAREQILAIKRERFHR